jgi:hypothetical protein
MLTSIRSRTSPAERVDRRADQLLAVGPVGDVAPARHRCPAGRLHLSHDVIGRCPDVVDDDERAVGGEGECVRAADALSGAGHDDDAAVTRHRIPLCSTLGT